MSQSQPSPPVLSQEEFVSTSHELKSAPAERVLTWAEDMVLIDLARKHAPSVRLFTLDTGRLPPETYELMETVRKRYGLEVETFFPERNRVEALESAQGYFSFKQSIEARKQCCGLRKVEPLKRALAGRHAWLTGWRCSSWTRTMADW